MNSLNTSNTITAMESKRRNKLATTILKWILLILLVLVALYFGTRPLRIKSAQQFVQSGDNYLLQKKYLQADLEYRKSLILNPTDEARDRRELVDLASKNITELKRIGKNNGASLKAFAIAEQFPEDETGALKLAKKLIEDGEFQLAAIPATTATEMDPAYRDAWLYLGIARLKTAESIQLSPDNTAIYIEEAKNAFKKALECDPEDQTSKEYLAKLNS